MTEFTCPSCEKNFRTQSQIAGKRIRCPQCKSPIRIPVTQQAVNGPANEPSRSSYSHTLESPHNDPPADIDRDERVDQIIADYLSAQARGEAPEPDELMAEHPDLADSLRSFFANDDAMRKVAGSPDESAEDLPTIPPSPGNEDPATLPPANAIQDTATIPPTEPRTASPEVSLDHVQVPGYEILSELGRGGMGVVYKARHVKLNRVVALKMILSGGHASSEDIARFLAEAEAVATFTHPNIVQVYEVSHHNNLPFMALEFVSGGTLEDRLKGGPFRPKTAARLMEQIAHGMNAAHQAGIVHRDLKPANVLVTKDGVPKVTDFGLAKKVEGGAGLTATDAIMGTPSYMAPEQAAGDGKRVGPAADVYALGAILYRCLTGRPPFQAGTPLDTILQVVSEEPMSPSQINSKVPKDLETICLKCLNKDPLKRYASAEAFGDDLRRYLNDEPISARPVSRTERMVKWARRNTAVAASLLAVFLVLVLGVAMSTWQAVRATIAEGEAKTNEELAKAEAERANQNEKDAKEQAGIAKKAKHKAQTQAKLAKAEADRATKALDQAEHALYLSKLDQAAFVYQKEPYKALEYLHDYRFCPIHRRCAIWRFYERQCTKWHKNTLRQQGSVTCVSFSPDGKTIVSSDSRGMIRLWNVQTGQVMATFTGHSPKRVKGKLSWPSIISSVIFSPDGKTLASASGDRIDANRPGEIILWDVKTRKAKATLKSPGSSVLSVSFSPDGKTLASAGHHFDKSTKKFWGEVNLWDIKTGQVITSLKAHTSKVYSVIFSPDGTTLASASTGIALWDLTTDQDGVVRSAQVRATFNGHTRGVRCVRFSPDGNTLASAGASHDAQTRMTYGEVKLWDVKTGVEKYTLQGHKSMVSSVSFSPDGKTLASSSGPETSGSGANVEDGVIKLWDLSTGQPLTSLRGHSLMVSSVRFSPDGRTLASASFDSTIKLWEIEFGQEKATFKVHNSFSRDPTSITFSPDGKTLATSTANANTIKLLNVVTEKEIATFRGRVVSFSLDGKTLAWARSQTIKLCDSSTGQERASLMGHSGTVYSLIFSPDGKTLASRSYDSRTRQGEIKLWDIKTRQEKAVLKGRPIGTGSLSFSPDGQTIAMASYNFRTKIGEIRLWDVQTGVEHSTITFQGHTGRRPYWSISPDGKTLALAGEVANKYREIRLWDVATGQAIATLKGHQDIVTPMIFSPDGLTLASVSRGPLVQAGGPRLPGEIKLWDVKTGREKGTFTGHKGQVLDVSFSPDGKTLASAGGDTGPLSDHIPGEIKLWDVATGKAIATLTGHSSTVWSVSFSPDGKTLASVSQDRTVKLWDIMPNPEIATLKGHTGTVTSMSFDSKGQTLVTVSRDKTIKLWDVKKGQVKATLLGHLRGVLAAGISPDGKIVASVSAAYGRRTEKQDGGIKFWDATTGKIKTTHKLNSIWVRAAFSPDGKTLALTSSLAGPITLWDVQTGKVTHSVGGPRLTVSSMCFSPDGRTLASASPFGGPTKLWDVKSGKVVATLKRVSKFSISSVSFSPDGKTLALSGGRNDFKARKSWGEIRLWDVKTGKDGVVRSADARATLIQPHSVTSICFSPDGKTLASGSAVGTRRDIHQGEIKLWDANTGQEKLTLNGHTNFVVALSFSPDGQTLASASSDKTIKLWNVDTVLAEAAAKRRALAQNKAKPQN